MSRRHIKKVYGTSELSTVDSSDEEYEPQCTKASKKTNTYAGLEVELSKSESEDSEAVETTSNEDADDQPKKKSRLKSKQSNSGADDDIDNIVSQVNAMLGEPSPKPDPVTEDKPNQFEKIFSLRKTHLNVTNEIKKLLGPDESEGNRRTKRQQKTKDNIRNPITPVSNYPYKRKGLSMTLYRCEGGINYFVYVHNLEYQKWHRQLIAYSGEGNNPRAAPVLESFNNLHVEGMLEAFKIYCEAEDYTSANNILEHAISYLQYTADPLFNVTTGRVRLPYKYVENRAFHIAILLYSHMLSSKSCHRTALELGKMLLNLDPLDPLGVIFVLDVFAIRAREYAWLIEVIDFMDRDRAVKHLLNMKYSYALAHFHVANKKKEDLTEADDLLKDALMSFPSLLKAILSNTKLPEKIQSNLFFSADESVIVPLRDSVKLYAAFLAVRWKEPPVLEWLLRNTEELIDGLQVPEVQKHIEYKMRVRRTLFSVMPAEICRHLILIKPLSNLIVDGLVPFVTVYPHTVYFNPLPVTSTSVNGYCYPTRRYSLHEN